MATRVQKVAPFLKFDHDPYGAVVGGHLNYILDAYTTTSLYPYSQEADLSDATGGHLSGTANYIRNSVKVVMNAYDGTLRFYVTEPNDPLIQVWRNAFPHMFTDVSDAPDELVEHFRYPEDLLSVQATQFSKYHVTDPQTFYGNERVWEIPAALPTTPPNKNPVSTSPGPFFPYYVLSKIPGSDSEHFVLFEPFSPPKRTNMVAYLAAGSDGYGSTGGSKDAGLYGNLTSQQFPTNGNVIGPARARSLINQDPAASSQITLLSQQGSGVLFGDLVVVPIADSFLYVQPIFLASSQTNSIPQLKLVAVVNGGDVFLGTNLTDALTKAFGTQSQTCPDGSPPPCITPPTGQTPADLLAQAQNEFNLADVALKAGDLAGYQAHIKAAEALVAQAEKLLGTGSGSGSGSGGTPTPTPSGTP
jgi:uncharacterized membrane protein (UPF0182 family)